MIFVSAGTDVALAQKLLIFNLSYAHVIGVTWEEGGKGSKIPSPQYFLYLNFFWLLRCRGA
jgi:hypothetical protein